MKRLLVSFFLCLAGATAQGTPDCVRTFSLSNTALTSGNLQNVNTGCTSWVVTYTSSGYSAITLAVQSAPDSSGVAGTFVTFAGTVDSGINPNTNIAQQTSELTGYYPWLRVNLTAHTGTGTIHGVLYGYKTGGAASGGSGTVPNPIQVEGPDAAGAPSTTPPVQIAGNDGTNVERIKTDVAGNLLTAGVTQAGVATYACNSQAAITLSGSGNTQIIAASGSTTIRICHISISSDTSEDIKITRGTGSNCGTGTADVTGLYKTVTALALDFTPSALLRGAASGAICINQSAAANAGGVVIYAQY